LLNPSATVAAQKHIMTFLDFNYRI